MQSVTRRWAGDMGDRVTMRDGSRRMRVLALGAIVVGMLAGMLAPVTAVRAATFTVTNTNDGGAGSLRAAIQAANAGAGGDTITFNIGGGGLQTIQPTPMDFIRKPMTIDATTQPGYAGVPLIQLNGANASFDSGFTILGGTTTIKGFVINGYTTGSGINVASNNNRIQANYIGVDSSGTVASPNGQGVFVSGLTAADTVRDNLIGGTTAAERNLFAGNAGTGVALDGNNRSTVTNNTVSGNWFGIAPDGVTLVRNPAIVGSQQVGIAVTSASNNTIGGTTPGARNVISGARIDNKDKGAGIAIDGRTRGASGNVVIGNFIGTDVSGTRPIINNAGVYIDTASGNRVGGTTVAERNIIAASNTGGVIIDGSFAGSDGTSTTGNVVKGNYIGTDVTGTLPVQSSEFEVQFGGTVGVGISAANDNIVGGTEAGAGNLIAGNGLGGVTIDSQRSTGPNGTAARNIVQGNIIGLNVAGASIARMQEGVIVTGAVGTVVGGTTAGARNVIGSYFRDGVLIINSPQVPGSIASDTVVQGNFIGVGTDGATAAPGTCPDAGETCYAVRIAFGPSNNAIGGTAAGAGNILANSKHAVLVQGTPGTGNAIEGNSIFNNSLFAIRLLNNGNNNQVAPALTGAAPSSPTQITVNGSLTGPDGTGYRIELFATPAANMPNNVPQGKTLLGFLDFVADGTAKAFSAPVTSAPAGQFITATATDVRASDTSAFSNAVPVTAGPAASVTANPGTTPQSALVNTFYAPLAVTVRDIAGNPKSGVPVTFRAPTIGASGFFGGGVQTIVVATDANGVASAAFVANGTPGAYQVTASAAGVGGTVTFALANTVPPLPGGKPPGPGQGNANPLPGARPPGGAQGNPNPLPPSR